MALPMQQRLDIGAAGMSLAQSVFNVEDYAREEYPDDEELLGLVHDIARALNKFGRAIGPPTKIEIDHPDIEDEDDLEGDE